jgi:Asp-tRNA(Asn)/Glu-tRNA(Gln) amidotransferase A subunit family amidase
VKGLCADSIAAIASLYELDDADRHEAWLGRVRLDEAVIELLDEAPIPVSQGVVDVHSLIGRPERERWYTRPVLHEPEAVPPRTAGEEAAAVREGRTRAIDLVERSLQSAHRQRHLNALTALFEEQARKEARAIDRGVSDGEDVGPLAGVTVAIKDLISVRGYATTGGTRVLKLPPASEDAAYVARLRRAGAVVVGMANLHGLAYGAMGINPDYGRVLNPRREEAVAGGSSGGSGASVAAGIAAGSLGTDTGGSVRLPAACCGVVGLKPTFGRVPTSGVYPLGRTMDHVGPVARTVGDAALFLEVLSDTPFPAASTAWRDLEDIVVGVPRTYFLEDLADEVRDALDECKKAVLESGGEVVDTDIPSMRYAPAAQLFTIAADAFDVHRQTLAERADDLPEDVRLRLEMGMFFLAADYVRAQRLRGMLQREVDEALEEADVLLTPTAAITAPDADVQEVSIGGVTWPTQFALSRLAMPFTVTGHPALTLPWGSDARGCPIGLQLVGRPMEEAAILGTGRVLERHRGEKS